MAHLDRFSRGGVETDFVGSSYRFATPYLKFGNQTFLKSGQSGFLGNSITSAQARAVCISPSPAFLHSPRTLQVFTLVSNAITTGALPLSSSAAYAVFTSQEIVEGSSGSSFCAQVRHVPRACRLHTDVSVPRLNCTLRFAFLLRVFHLF